MTRLTALQRRRAREAEIASLKVLREGRERLGKVRRANEVENPKRVGPCEEIEVPTEEN